MTTQDKRTSTGVVQTDGSMSRDRPQWRRDFPVDRAEDEYVARRDLVKFIVLTSLAFTVGQFWLVGKRLLGRKPAPVPPQRIARVEDLSVGDSLSFRYPVPDSPPRLLIRTGPASFVAYSQECTHLMCPVIPRVREGILHCPCHEGVFDLETGRPVAGPPRRPLVRIDLEIRDGAVYATGLTGGTA